jgi:hypothetical protein
MSGDRSSQDVRSADYGFFRPVVRFAGGFFSGFWWGVRVLWWWVWWSRSARVLLVVLWSASGLHLLRQRSAGNLFLFEIVSLTTLVVWVGPVIWGSYRLYTRVSHPTRAGWQLAGSEVARELDASWPSQLFDLGFELAGYLSKHRQGTPRAALFVHRGSLDSAHVARISGGPEPQNLLVFKARFDDGFAFETANTRNPSIYPSDQRHPVFKFPQIRFAADLYRIHSQIKRQYAVAQRPVIADAQGELAEFISRSEIARQRMMGTRDHKLKPFGDEYAFTLRGAIRHTFLLTWPVRPIRELKLRYRALKKIRELGFGFDAKSGRLSES